MVRDAAQYRKDSPHRVDPGRGAEWCAGLFWSAPRPFDASAAVSGEPLAAFLNEGRWVVSCPDCESAQLAATDDLRFMCVDCGNERNADMWRPVVLPGDKHEIETALEQRDDTAKQNWTPGKSVDDLIRENDELKPRPPETPPPEPVPDPPIDEPPPEEVKK